MRLDLFSESRPGSPIVTLDVDPARVRGTRTSFGPQLHIGVQVDYDPSKHRPVVFEGTLAWPHEHYGLLIPMQTVGGGSAELLAPVSDHEIAAIERKRAGADPSFDLHVRAVGTPDEKGVVGRYTSTNPFNLRIPRDVWKAVLDGFGVASVRIIELPSKPTADEPWKRASELLDAAASMLSEGRYGESVSTARSAIERIAESVGLSVGFPRDGKNFAPYVDALSAHLKDRRRGADPFALIGHLIKAAAGWTSHPVHQGFDVSERDDAIFALNLSVALYSYLARASIPVEQSSKSDGG